VTLEGPISKSTQAICFPMCKSSKNLFRKARDPRRHFCSQKSLMCENEPN
jgi:hypothetical protein